jgi:glycolate oxidase
MNTGARTVKNVAGYDVTRLMVGSEGTLGIVTSAILRLLPRPPERRTLFCVFPQLQGASEAAAEIIASGFSPSALEILDERTTAAVETHAREGLGGGVWLLVELDGTKAFCEEEGSKVEELVKGSYGAAVSNRSRGADLEQLWRARRQVLPALSSLASTLVVEDITVPRSNLPRMVGAITEIGEEYDLRVAIYGHAGEGNLHPTFLRDRRHDDQMERIASGVSDMVRVCLDLGGRAAPQCGVGMDKISFLRLETGGAGCEIMNRLKDAVDPKGIMNPGKMFYGTSLHA